MMLKRYILCFMILWMVVLLTAGERVVIRLEGVGTAVFQRFQENQADIAAYYPGRYLDLVIPLEEVEAYQREFPGAHVTQTEEALQQNLHSADRSLNGYHSYATMLSELNTIAAAHPDICRLYDLGPTLGAMYYEQGQSAYANSQFHLWAMKVSDNPDSEEDEPSVYFFGAHHAREPLGVETTLRILNNLVSNYGTNPSYTNRVDSLQIWIVPLVNPDGHRVVWDNVDEWWRKNIHDNNANFTFDTWNQYGYGDDGTDLNRNYGPQWGTLQASDDMTSPTYHGSSPFSEPETTLIKNLIESHHFTAGISYHTYGGLVLFPPGYYPHIYARDSEALQAWATEIAANVVMSGNTHYTPEPSWELYPCMGGLDDFAYLEHGIFGFTVEMAQEFIPSASVVTQVVANNQPGANLLMDKALRPALTGVVTDSVSTHPIVAKIELVNLDQGSLVPQKPYYSDELYGRYYRYLPENASILALRASAWGYQTMTKPNIIVHAGQTVHCDIHMIPAPISSLFGKVIDAATLLGIQDAVIHIPDTPLEDIHTDAQGQFEITAIPAAYYQVQISKNGYDYFVGSMFLSAGENSVQWTLQGANILIDFETPLSWITTGNWTRSNAQHVSGSYCLVDSPAMYDGVETESTAQYPVAINTEMMPNVSVSFMMKCQFFPEYDYVTFEVSRDQQNWSTVDTYYGQSAWVLKKYNLNQYLGGNFYFRFHFVSSGYGNGDGIYIDDIKVYTYSEVVPNVDTEMPLPVNRLMQNYPNPFHQSTTIRYEQAEKGEVNLDIFNVKGQCIRSYHQQNTLIGMHQILWDGKDDNGKRVGSGMYLYRLQTKSGNMYSRRMVLIR